jgi:hypothetical protein
MAAKERFCFNCGASLGVVEDRHHDRLDTCGARDCEREVHDMLREQHEEAHEQLDRDMGW